MPQPNHRILAGELAEIISHTDTSADAWSEFAKRFCEAIPGTKAAFLANDSALKRDVSLVQFGFDNSILSTFAEHYGYVNPWTASKARLPILSPQRTEKFHPASSFSNAEFYRDFLVPLGESDGATVLRIWGDGKRNAELVVHYAARNDQRLNAVIEPVLTALAPVMNDALARLRIRILTDHETRRSHFVDAMADPAFILSRTGKVLAANAPAQALVQQGGLLRIAVGDRLEILDLHAENAVRESTAKVTRGERLLSGTETIRFGQQGRSHSAAIYPMMTHLGGGFGLLAPTEASILLVIRPVLEAASLSAELLRERFGLTAAEARLAMKFTAGASLPEISRVLNISYQTGRTQLRSVFAKLNVRRQAEMVALLLSIVG